ncbi:MurR/RpiR family transcriptional regulator [Microbacterium indicum]|uniref:MurR/RpiR family transcriptional regulator n=1 Tax=Microbacterium indicum TaxID=358100 RepID=UPI000416FD6B|nr:MurR/RpiR family transcriptional regulator [Microbacterium indicum]
MSDNESNGVTESGDTLRRWLGTLQARAAGLPQSEARVAELLLTDPLFVGTASTSQVAARAGVSAPSVVRAARALGFAGFAELKLEIARARGSAEFFAPPPALTGDDSARAILEASIRTGVDALTALGGALDPAALESAVDAVRAARQVLVSGAAASASVAADAAFRMRALGVPTVAIPDHTSAMIAARLLGPGDVLLAVSSTGRTAATVDVADAASGAGAAVIAVTNQHGTPLADAADIALVVGGVPLTGQMAAAGSRLAQLVVVDAIVAALALRDPERVRRSERAGIDLPDIS